MVTDILSSITRAEELNSCHDLMTFFRVNSLEFLELLRYHSRKSLEGYFPFLLLMLMQSRIGFNVKDLTVQSQTIEIGVRTNTKYIIPFT